MRNAQQGLLMWTPEAQVKSVHNNNLRGNKTKWTSQYKQNSRSGIKVSTGLLCPNRGSHVHSMGFYCIDVLRKPCMLILNLVKITVFIKTTLPEKKTHHHLLLFFFNISEMTNVKKKEIREKKNYCSTVLLLSHATQSRPYVVVILNEFFGIIFRHQFYR